jgi:hypothetical protein
MPLTKAARYLAVRAWARAYLLRAHLGDRGYSTETVLVTVALAALALAVVAILGPKIIAKASSINLGG